MSTEPNLKQIIRTLTGQLESELLLGGYWLPMAFLPPDYKSPISPSTTISNSGKAPVMSPQQISLIEEKRLRLAEVTERIAHCCDCSLHQRRLNIVPGEGNPDARLVFIGEAPGQTEDEQGRPFVGRAGKLLTNIIEAMGLRRQDVFIGNILKCRPPNNRDPQANEITACINYLFEQLEIIEPDVIVALGAHAARTLLNTNSPIGQLRGRIHEYVPHPFAKPIKLIATYHPAYLLRNYSRDTRLRVWQDMQKVLQILELPIPKK